MWLLVYSHLACSFVLFALQLLLMQTEVGYNRMALILILLQIYVAGQLLLPALTLQPQPQSRGTYLLWTLILMTLVWSVHQLRLPGDWDLLRAAIGSGVLLLVGVLVGTTLARYIKRLWEVIPVCLVMSFADFFSWSKGPTAGFAQEIEQYYRAPEGPVPLIDMVLVKFAVPGFNGLIPVFGLSDWIMVVFFAAVTSRHQVNDNLLAVEPFSKSKARKVGRYLPVSLAALSVAIVLAQVTARFVPVLPIIALGMLVWFGGRRLLRRPG